MLKAVICDVRGVLVDGGKINENLVEFLIKNKKRYGFLILYSNSGRKGRQKFLELIPQLFNIVDKEYFAFNFDYLKPNPKGFEQILFESDLKPEEVIFIDDNSSNVEVAKELDIKVILYDNFEDISTLKTLLDASKRQNI